MFIGISTQVSSYFGPQPALFLFTALKIVQLIKCSRSLCHQVYSTHCQAKLEAIIEEIPLWPLGAVFKFRSSYENNTFRGKHTEMDNTK